MFVLFSKKEIENDSQPLLDYFKMLYNSDVNEMRIDVAENHSVVMLPTLEF